MNRSFLVLSVALATSLCACAPVQPTAPTGAESSAPLIAAPALSIERYAAQLKAISDDRFEGRAPGTNGETATLNYLEGEFRRIGIGPGNGDSYRQAVPMVEINPDRRSMALKVGARTLSYGREFVAGSRTDQRTVTVNNAPIVFAGYGVSAPELGWNDYVGLDVRGKIVVVLINDPGFGNQDPKLFQGPAMTYYGRWTYKFEEAARQGAAGVLIVHDTAGAAYGWDVVEVGWQKPLYDLQTTTPVAQTQFQGWLTSEAATAIFADANQDFAKLKAQADVPGFKPVALDAKGSLSITSTRRAATSDNFVARLPGRTRPDEVVMYMAHWDHLGRNFAAGQDQILNGAIDNASGVAAVIEMAELFKRAPQPERSIVFFLPTLEESGLLGSRYYAENPLYPLNKTVAGVNMDAMSLIGPTNDVVVTGYGSSELEDVLKRYAAQQNRRVEPEPTPENGFFFRSDHFSFAKLGVPVLYAEGGFDHRTKGVEYGRQAAAAYTANAYHKPSDEFDPSWDLSGIREDLILLYQVGADVANAGTWPAWYADSPFRSIREASLKGG
jgi:Zn-dependent M28 family amino/carboxypeptidase